MSLTELFFFSAGFCFALLTLVHPHLIPRDLHFYSSLQRVRELELDLFDLSRPPQSTGSESMFPMTPESSNTNRAADGVGTDADARRYPHGFPLTLDLWQSLHGSCTDGSDLRRDS
ncbi:hypothetical protein BROUX41_002430 [Berkeleyomyces rouxiae]|uniref:uncharacterized protein n=1 Tax=Berkeleyomyces rouxiae TaxID=2035830 RepID=UPI003B802F3C